MFEGFADRIRTVLIRPAEGFRMVSDRPSLVESLLLVLVTIGLVMFYYFSFNAAAVNREFILYYENMTVAETSMIPGDFTSLATYIVTRWFILWIGGALIVNLVAQFIGGRSSILRMLVIVGYCTLPIIVLTVIACVPIMMLEPYDVTLYYFMGNNTSTIYFGAGGSPYYMVGRALILMSSVVPVFYLYFGIRESMEFVPRRLSQVKEDDSGKIKIPKNFSRDRTIITTAIAFAVYFLLASEFSPYAMI